MKTRLALVGLSYIGFTFCMPVYGVEISINAAVIDIPQDKEVALSNYTVVEVDKFKIQGKIFTEGNVFRINVNELEITNLGSLQGYSPANTPSKPPKIASFSTAASNGPTMKDGADGLDGAHGEKGVSGNNSPSYVSVVTGTLTNLGTIKLTGQNGSNGGNGQDGQIGGNGGRAIDAKCHSGKTGVSCTSYRGEGLASGLGGLGGRPGEGGPGGDGGAAIPIIIIAYNGTDNLGTIESWPGGGGARGNPGEMGFIGSNGDAGYPCKAKAKWLGSLFRCSGSGGPRSEGDKTDNRPSRALANFKEPNVGQDANWVDVIADNTKLSFLKNTKGNKSLLVFDISKYTSKMFVAARNLELLGRYALMLRKSKELHSKLKNEKKEQFRQESLRYFIEVAKPMGELVNQNSLYKYYNLSDTNGYVQQIDTILPVLRKSFKLEKSNLVNLCAVVEKEIVTHGINDPKPLFQRLFDICNASSLNWIPLEPGVNKITVRSTKSIVPDVFLPFFNEYEKTITPKNIKSGSSSIDELPVQSFQTSPGTVIAEANQEDRLSKIVSILSTGSTMKFSLGESNNSLMFEAKKLLDEVNISY